MKPIEKFVNHLSKMSHLKRMALFCIDNKQDLAQHSYNVAVYTHIIGLEIKETLQRVLGESIDVNKAVVQALYHDFEEPITTDVPYPLKEEFGAEIMNKIDAYGSKSIKELLCVIPPYQITNIFEKTSEYYIVKLADYIDLFVWVGRKLNSVDDTTKKELLEVQDTCVTLLQKNPFFRYSGYCQEIIGHGPKPIK
ncbi:HD containing hydrolase-like enzyme [Maribacter phage Colly_1]|uniref:HD containing hydrolase-like enzyme n=1 Tax=Maribacter phage Colly_1 TaxID=2745691 RepID=A0A8E4UXS8_9CAUD|nr:HD containing hydrolase-like enzyme [Maribacter phage Colly_1]QQO97213.1 HD containing hydrolase-like enzyme [Maribacter phage Colly_1]